MWQVQKNREYKRIVSGHPPLADYLLFLYFLNIKTGKGKPTVEEPNNTGDKDGNATPEDDGVQNTKGQGGDKDGQSGGKNGEAYESPKAKKKTLLKKNNKDGKQREEEVKQELIEEGNEVIGSQVSVKTKYTRRIVDHLIKEKGTGEIKAIEVKNGKATRNSTQIKKDNSMSKDGGIIIGKNAPKDLKGQTIKIKTEVKN